MSFLLLQLRFSAHRTYFIIFPFVRLVVFQHVLVGLATCLRAWRHRVQGVTGDRAVTGHAQNSRRAPSTAALRWAVTGHANETPPRGTFSPPSVFSPPSSPPSSPLISSPLLLSPRGNSMTCGVLPTSTLLSNRQTLPPGQAPAHCLVVEVFVFSLVVCRPPLLPTLPPFPPSPITRLSLRLPRYGVVQVTLANDLATQQLLLDRSLTRSSLVPPITMSQKQFRPSRRILQK